MWRTSRLWKGRPAFRVIMLPLFQVELIPWIEFRLRNVGNKSQKHKDNYCLEIKFYLVKNSERIQQNYITFV